MSKPQSVTLTLAVASMAQAQAAAGVLISGGLDCDVLPLHEPATPFPARLDAAGVTADLDALLRQVTEAGVDFEVRERAQVTR